MNITEIEVMTGLTRGNIRYYEKEGLIEVDRLENGYRDYSLENVDELRRIILLRRLQFTIDEIRRLKSGESELGDALMAKAESIGGQIAELEKARAVCSEILADRVSYSQIDAKKYLGHMNQSVIESDTVKGSGHPWRRFLAFCLDDFFYGLLLNILIVLPLGYIPNGNGLAFRIISLILGIALMLFIEPLLLSRFGTTLGKKIFGLCVYHESGRKLTYSESFERTFYKLKDGAGFNIPIYSLYRNYVSYRECSNEQVLDWDEEAKYVVKDTSWKNAVGGIITVSAVFALSLSAMVAGTLPRNKGELTVAEFAENFNQTSKSKEFYARMDSEGKVTFIDDGNTFYIGGEDNAPEIQFETVDGNVRAVSFETVETDGVIADKGIYEYLILWSLLEARENIFTYADTEDFIFDVIDKTNESASYSFRDIAVERTVENNGYDISGNYFFKAAEDEGSLSIEWKVEIK